MNMQKLVDLLQGAIDAGANPEQPVFTYDADAEKMLEIQCFTYGKTLYFYCDEG